MANNRVAPSHFCVPGSYRKFIKYVVFVFFVEAFLNISIQSRGCDDPGNPAGSCGIAYITVNEEDHSPHGRGHNVVTVDAKTGKVAGSCSYGLCSEIYGMKFSVESIA